MKRKRGIKGGEDSTTLEIPPACPFPLRKRSIPKKGLEPFGLIFCSIVAGSAP
jgi:hypothetical protein